MQKETLRQALCNRILLLDGGIGTMIQKRQLSEQDFRGSLFTGHPVPLSGNNDVLSLTRPDVIEDEVRQYLEAGADIVTTNTFSSQSVSQQEYGLTGSIADMNRASVRIARRLADEFTARNPLQPRYVAGSVGPTSKMLSMSDDVNNPAARAITFDELEAAYLEQIRVLVEEGVDAVLVETIFDTLNAKAAISAYMKVANDGARQPSLMLSMTVSDASGRTLSGQTVEAFVASVSHASPLTVGLNCGLGADGLLPWLRRMSAVAPCMVSCHPNAGLPNQFGQYDQDAARFSELVRPLIDGRLVNVIGGCCGTTPAHIAAVRRLIDSLPAGYALRQPVAPSGGVTVLSGLEPLCASSTEFIHVGERCNVAGSRKFLRLINEKKYDEALEIAHKQVEDGAMVVDVNMDDGLLDAKAEMRTFLNLLASDPAISRVPVMVDSSRFDVIEEGLKCLQGKGVVNSISLKMGEEEFLAHARVVKRLGAAVIVMCFDEEGQATDYARRVAICQRTYRLLTSEVGFAPEDIIFDPNVLTIATGMAEHNDYAADFIRATRWVRDNLPGTRVSGGLSNLSFAFRGNNYLREAMHSCFLHLAMPQGMNMAILNPATAVPYATIPADLRLAIVEVIMNTSPDASDQLQTMAQAMLEAKEKGAQPTATSQPSSAAARPEASAAPAAQLSPEEVLVQCLLKGTTAGLSDNLHVLLDRGLSPVRIISGPLMDGMNQVGTLFGQGRMFLPQVVKTARTMKAAVDVLQPYIEAANAGAELSSTKNGRIVLATVKGDVHDIGKNIVGVVLACNNFEVIDLGVMVAPELIVRTAVEQNADIVCLSGLITPSLEEMCTVARQMQAAGLSIPLFVGGATTSARHTAMKIAPLYDGPVFHLRDAAQNPVLALRLMDASQRGQVIADNRQRQHALLNPCADGVPVSSLIPLIDWNYFFWAWRTKADTEAGASLRADADRLLAELADPDHADAFAPRFRQSFYPAVGKPDADSIVVTLRHNDHDPACPCCNQTLTIPTVRRDGHALCDYLADATAQQQATASGQPLPDYLTQVGVFAVTMSPSFTERLENLKNERGGGDYDVLLLQTIGDRLAEAASEYLSRRMASSRGWGGIRPAVGYPSLPDQKIIFQLARMVDFNAIGVRLTENGAMYPQASVCGLYFGNPDARY